MSYLCYCENFLGSPSHSPKSPCKRNPFHSTDHGVSPSHRQIAAAPWGRRSARDSTFRVEVQFYGFPNGAYRGPLPKTSNSLGVSPNKPQCLRKSSFHRTFPCTHKWNTDLPVCKRTPRRELDWTVIVPASLLARHQFVTHCQSFSKVAVVYSSGGIWCVILDTLDLFFINVVCGTHFSSPYLSWSGIVCIASLRFPNHTYSGQEFD